jgi:hypothetical protein
MVTAARTNQRRHRQHGGAVRAERQKVTAVFDEAHGFREFAEQLSSEQERAEAWHRTNRMIEAALDPVRLSVATSVLHFDDKTIRMWVNLRILKKVDDKPRITVDPVRLFEVLEIIRDLRARRLDKDFTNAVWTALQDQSVAEIPDVQQGLSEMMAGKRRSWRDVRAELVERRPEDFEDGS